MRIGLDRVVQSIDRAQRLQLTRLLAHRGQVIDVAWRGCGTDFEQLLAALLTPPRCRRRQHLTAAVQGLPAGTEQRAVVRAQRACRDQQFMQMRQQFVHHILIHHKGEIEVVGRLRNHVHAQLAELSEHARERMQHGAHAAANQRDRRTRRNHFHTAHLGQVAGQCGERVGIEQVFGRVQRHGDVGLRRADHVHRQAMLLELREHVGEEADLLPHAHRFHRDQRDALARADRFHARRMLAHFGTDQGAFQLGPVGVLDQQRHARLTQRRQAARMQHLGAGGGDFLGLFVIQSLQQSRAGHLARVGSEHASDVGPDFHPLRFQQRAEVRGGGIRTTTAQQYGAALRFTRNETLRDEHVTQRSKPRIQRRIRFGLDHRREQLGALILVGQRDGSQAIARIHPLRGQTTVGKERRAQRAGHQFAVRLHQCRPGQLAQQRRAIVGQLRQFGQSRAEGVGNRQLHVIEQVVVTLCDRLGSLDAFALVFLCAHLFECVGDTGECRNDNEHAGAFGAAAGYQLQNVLPARQGGDTGAAKLHHDPGCVGRKRRGGIRGHGSLS